MTDQPDDDCTMTDEFGRKMYLFSLEYKFDDRTWCLDVWAYSFDEAEQRVKAMQESLSLAGMVYARGEL
jgi:hypothetical protein